MRKIRFPEQKLYTEQQCILKVSEHSNCTEKLVDSKRSHTMQLRNFINRHRTLLQQLFLFSLAICLVVVSILFVLYTFGPEITLIAGIMLFSIYVAGASDV